MTYCTVESILAFEHIHLDANSWIRSVNYRFTESTIIENVHQPGLYISIIGECQGQTRIPGMDPTLNFSHQCMVSLLDQACHDPMYFPNGSVLQMLSIMLPLDHLQESRLLPKQRAAFIQAVPQIKLAELGPVPYDVLCCCQAAWECDFEGIEREWFIKAKAQEVLALLLNKRRKATMPIVTNRMRQMHSVLNHVQAHLDQEWSLAGLARLARSNETYVKRDIKALTGGSFRQWLGKARLEAARDQLSRHDTITQVALNVGFKNQAHFSTRFKTEFGITPREYRRSILG
ncbi:AraC family transcriptional regulator [Marinomonas rhizomae]|uniref:AraC-like DNA-binding protein n=1 Tax=Marinomonas rhizomae TaxID=491948 RepID=A0A366JDT6_9GAMM|nr:AraC family transcriptional regulator [Marinomonas rhizomae]RBP85151.1 AraC-like DNA-binding protein [Marinomonas rhizomae]RNF76256.1 AraC family transcriptional regulator [Marinomonas rhizomae]